MTGLVLARSIFTYAASHTALPADSMRGRTPSAAVERAAAYVAAQLRALGLSVPATTDRSTGPALGRNRYPGGRTKRKRGAGRALVWRGATVLIVSMGTVPSVAGSQQQPGASTAALVFDGATVVDVEGGKLLPDQRVMIRGNHIEAVGGASTVKLPKGAQVVDARGKYLIPGLWDMHFHVQSYPDVMYPLAIANGVTGVRDMNNAHLDSLLKWRREITTGERVGPRMILTGGYLGVSGDFDSEIKVTTPERARQVVDSLKSAGVDFIKVRIGLSRDVYFAALAEARRIGIPLVGHLSDSVTATEASEGGQATIEHSRGCRDSDTDRQCAALAAQFVRRGTWATPTLVLLRYFFGGVAPDRRRFWPDTVRERFPFQRTTDSRIADEATQTRQLAKAIRAGIPFLAGTDAAPEFPENTSGFSLHEELAWFVEAGMPPLEALRTATLNPAKYLNATDSLGTVASGKLADLVLLDADPLADITNTTRIRAVLANGRYLDRAALDGLVAEVEAKARGKP